MLKDKRVVITGSEGFVGRHLQTRLREEGAEVVSIDVSSGIDITDYSQLMDLDMLNVDIIYHLAAKTHIPSTSVDPRTTYAVNLNGTLNMLEIARMNGIATFIFASAYVYGIPCYFPIDEDHPVNPVNPYNRSKYLAEELCKAYCEDHGLKCVALRAFNIYGEGQREGFLIPDILRQIRQGEIIINDPKPKRDFVYVEDVVNAYIKAASFPGSGFDMFNIGSGISYSVDEVVQQIINVWGGRVKVSYRFQQRQNEIADTIASITKARKKLGWIPEISFREGITKCAKELEHQP